MELIDFEKNIELTNLEWSLEYEGYNGRGNLHR